MTKMTTGFVEKEKINNFVLTKATVMKKVLALLALVVFLSACSQYTCPTYSKKDVKKSVAEKKI